MYLYVGFVMDNFFLYFNSKIVVVVNCFVMEFILNIVLFVIGIL